jgi:hypothetical protein
MATSLHYLTSFVSGGVTSPNNALGAANSAFTGDGNQNNSWSTIWALANFATNGTIRPTGSVMRIYAGKGTNSGNPVITAVNLYSNGTLVQNLLPSGRNVTVGVDTFDMG